MLMHFAERGLVMRLSDYADPKYRSLSGVAWRYRIGLPLISILVGGGMMLVLHAIDLALFRRLAGGPLLVQAVVGPLVLVTAIGLPLLATFLACHRLYGRALLIRRRGAAGAGGRQVSMFDDLGTLATVVLIAPISWRVGGEAAALALGVAVDADAAVGALVAFVLAVAVWWTIMGVRARQTAAAA